MKFSNPEIPEGINTSKRHPLKDFFLLTSGVIIVVAVIVLVLGLTADKLAHYIPFEVEQKITQGRLPFGSDDGSMQVYLNGLAQKIAVAQALPDEMPITVHYLDDETVNAFATLGGHVYMFRGLLEKLPNENAITMVLAHEIAHIKHRHPIRSMGRGIVIGLALSMVSGSLGDVMVDRIVGNTGTLTALTFSRDQELESDETALDTLMAIYGNIAGADQLFEVLREAGGDIEMPEFFSTHPLSESRIKRIHNYKDAAGSGAEPVVTPLPDAFHDWLISSDDEEVSSTE